MSDPIDYDWLRKSEEQRTFERQMKQFVHAVLTPEQMALLDQIEAQPLNDRPARPAGTRGWRNRSAE